MCAYIYITIWQNEKNHQRDNIQLLACLSKRMHHPGPRAKAAHDAMKVERPFGFDLLDGRFRSIYTRLPRASTDFFSSQGGRNVMIFFRKTIGYMCKCASDDFPACLAFWSFLSSRSFCSSASVQGRGDGARERERDRRRRT